MMTETSLPITTDRLILRRFQSADMAAYGDYHRREEVYRFLYSSPPSAEAMEAQFSDLLSAPFEKDGDTLRLAVIRVEDGALVGEVLLKIASAAALQAEVGYIFNPVFSGKGYATEAVRAMITLGFRTLGHHRIFARLDALNHGSIGVAERLGMRKEAHLIENDRFDGVWGDEFIYAVLNREWRSGP
ncbi:GNAT family N-acetyltransferase [Agrobacterium fabrum]|uniref:GNAT family N-acetyltransferase n=1 Tax=Agrobacterium fabrum TaxID=1176649 RepID=UPI0015741D9F|nr:GNAT family protein [Agrobacterium fabrum]WCK77999.1 GNAT family protein [Agrobacterium fabrum]